MKLLNYIFCITAIFIVFFVACNPDESIITNNADIGRNPYDDVTNNNDTIEEATVDPISIVGLHKNIFSPKCAVPACHDGAFEPDYRSVMSTYNTLVYHVVEKNSEDSSFTYRVIPGDTGKSWLHERITTDDSVLGRMPLYDTLSQNRIDQIAQWILDGAKDMFGNVATEANNQPSLYGILAYINDTNGLRLDSIRPNNPYMAFEVPVDTTVDFWFAVVDHDGGDDYELGYTMTYNKIKFSTDPYGFAAATEQNLDLLLKAYSGEIFGGTSPIPLYYHNFKLNTSQYNVGDLVYFRVYVSDTEHSEATELPDDGDQYFLKAYFSFEVVSSI